MKPRREPKDVFLYHIDDRGSQLGPSSSQRSGEGLSGMPGTWSFGRSQGPRRCLAMLCLSIPTCIVYLTGVTTFFLEESKDSLGYH
jgi:hypothetical protein